MATPTAALEMGNAEQTIFDYLGGLLTDTASDATAGSTCLKASPASEDAELLLWQGWLRHCQSGLARKWVWLGVALAKLINSVIDNKTLYAAKLIMNQQK